MNAAAAADGGGGTLKRGVLGKRHADESRLNDEERFAKRLNLLSLSPNPQRNGNSNYYLPVSHPPSTPQSSLDPGPAAPMDADDSMRVDDTKDRVYIHNLDEELADIESDEERLVFLPDIEKRFSKIPRHVLTGRQPDEYQNQEMVLYGVPKSLTVDESHDSVRKAILEARQRARDRSIAEMRRDEMGRAGDQNAFVGTAETGPEHRAGYAEAQMDPDAMDIE